MNKKIFICYRSKNKEFAQKIKYYIEQKNQEEVLNIDEVFYSNDKCHGNYLIEALEKIKQYDFILFVVDKDFTMHFEKEETITSKEVLSIATRITEENSDDAAPYLYQINIGDTADEYLYDSIRLKNF